MVKAAKQSTGTAVQREQLVNVADGASARQQAIDAALRRQIEAQERRDDEAALRREQREREYAQRGITNPIDLENDPVFQAAMRSMSEASDRFCLALHLEGFVAGWLAATGQLERYSDLLQIWLDTSKRVGEPEPVEVTSTLARIAKVDGPKRHGASS